MDVLAFIAILTAYIWIFLPATQGKTAVGLAFTLLAVAMAAFFAWRKGIRWAQTGLKLRGFPGDLALYLGAAAAYRGIVLLLFRSAIVRFSEQDWPSPGRIPWFLTWALLQQFCLLAFLTNRLRQILRRDTPAAIVAAGLFAFFHLPNPFLVLYTLGGGLVIASIFLRRPSLPAATLAHALSSFLVANLLPGAITGWMRVGPLYWGRH
ncbi:MAG TPA: CPBP family glutamic-type intramembrane protease [Candidatus Polarisedimenticolia bacterium]|nr:CPBP family glutamic-type intramembrane protease [Candidatus Polarisedimenticolia bacterium]